MSILGLDIGGANLKFAIVDPHASDNGVVLETGEIYFPFWSDHQHFVHRLNDISAQVQQNHQITGVAVTMTAELADCFDNKQQGVHFIIDCVERALDAWPCRYYTTTGQLLDATAAKRQWSQTAASNWHASAWYLFYKHGLKSGFLVDIGSTTTDIIPVQAGYPVAKAANDFDRLASGQLLYAGIGRTPLCSLMTEVDLGLAGKVGIARELFATVADAATWLGHKDLIERNHGTADGRAADRPACRVRLCRMLCTDNDRLNDDQVDAIASTAVRNLKSLVGEYLQRVTVAHPQIPRFFCLAGGGATLASQVIAEIRSTMREPVEVVESFNDYAHNQGIPAIAVATKYSFEARGG